MWRSTTPSGGSVGRQRFVDQVEVTGGLTPPADTVVTGT